MSAVKNDATKGVPALEEPGAATPLLGSAEAASGFAALVELEDADASDTELPVGLAV